MLKGKKALYILLPLVAFIWGAIIFQVVGAFSDEDPAVSEATRVSLSPIKTRQREAFSLEVIERDPFLGTLYKPKKKKVNKTKSVVKKPALVWPSVTYKGVVSGKGNANAIYLIEINNTDQLMKLRQTVDEVTLIKAFSSSVRLRYKGKTKDFKIVH